MAEEFWKRMQVIQKAAKEKSIQTLGGIETNGAPEMLPVSVYNDLKARVEHAAEAGYTGVSFRPPERLSPYQLQWINRKLREEDGLFAGYFHDGTFEVNLSRSDL